MDSLSTALPTLLAAAVFMLPASGVDAAGADSFRQGIEPMLENYCLDCHDAETKKGDLDLESLKADISDPKTFAAWIKVHDRVRDGEMPPKKKAQPEPAERDGFLKTIAGPLTAADRARAESEGRATWRRLNRYEYENAVRDLLHAPWLQIKEMLPEDGERHRFNKVGDALDVSHVQMARYLGAAEYALRQAMATQPDRPATTTVRYYAREQSTFARKAKFNEFNRSSERATFPIIGMEADVPALEGKAPMSVGARDPERRELEAMGVVASTYEPLEIAFNDFEAPVAGRYKLRFNAFTFWAGPESEKKWWKPDRTKVSAGRTHEPVTIYSESPPHLLRRQGNFEVMPGPSVHELDVWLLAGETIRPDAVRLFRSRPPGSWHNPLAEKDGQPGVAFRWMEVEGPIYDRWPPAGHTLMFGDLPIRTAENGTVEVVSEKPCEDADRLLQGFMERAYRRPVEDADVERFGKVIGIALDSGSSFTEAMIAGCSAVLCSPGFVTLEEKPGPLDALALASRLSFFLTNSAPDAELRMVAKNGRLTEPGMLHAQAGRLLGDPKSRQFTDAFLDYWLDLRRATATSPDAALYPDYYLDDDLVDSAVEETQLFFRELLDDDLPGRNIVDSDFAMLNERLAGHYDLPPIEGVIVRKVRLPEDSVRGGLLTQASVLKVTANGTTTSPVLRGAWIMERILGKAPPPPPPNIPAVEPDTRGATTIREQLEKHRSLASCNVCHAKMDPAGFALESFDVLGGWQKNYRALGDGDHVPGFGKNGQPFEFRNGPPVDATGVLPDGREFKDIREFKRLLLEDERQIARNLASQLIVYATGAAVRFGDRPEVEAILDRASSSHYGVRTLIHEIVQSELFRNK